MKIEEKKSTMKSKISKNLKRAACLGVMFTLGASVFAAGHGRGTLQSRDRNAFSCEYDSEAVMDMQRIMEYQINTTLRKDRLDEDTLTFTKNNINQMKAQYDKDYGEGAYQAVRIEMDRYITEGWGRRICNQADKGEISRSSAVNSIVSQGVFKANITQKNVTLMHKTLKDAYRDEIEELSR